MKQLESFFWGILAALGAMVIELVFFLGYSFFVDPLGDFSVGKYYLLPFAMLTVAAIEEIFKFIVISRRIELLSFERSYVINAALAGMGFAAAELFLIRWYGFFGSNYAHNLVQISLLHIATASFIGYRIAVKNHRKYAVVAFTVLTATLMHFIYNFLEAFQGEYFSFAATTYIAIIVCISIINLFKIKTKLAA